MALNVIYGDKSLIWADGNTVNEIENLQLSCTLGDSTVVILRTFDNETTANDVRDEFIAIIDGGILTEVIIDDL